MLTQFNMADYANKLLAGPRPAEPPSRFVESLKTVKQEIAACWTVRRFCAGDLAARIGIGSLDVILAAEAAGASHFMENGRAFNRKHFEAHRDRYADGTAEDVEFSAQPAKLAKALHCDESEVLDG